MDFLYRYTKDFLIADHKRYKVSLNAKIVTLLKGFYSMNYDEIRGVKEYIVKIVHY